MSQVLWQTSSADAEDDIGAVELVVGADVADSGEAVGVVLPLATPVPPQAAGCIACTKQLAKDVCWITIDREEDNDDEAERWWFHLDCRHTSWPPSTPLLELVVMDDDDGGGDDDPDIHNHYCDGGDDHVGDNGNQPPNNISLARNMKNSSRISFECSPSTRLILAWYSSTREYSQHKRVRGTPKPNSC